MTALTDLSLRDVAAKIKAKDVSPVEVTQACLDRAAATEPKLTAFSCLLADSALAEAKASEAEITAGNWRGELHGVPVGIKELYDVKGVPTTSSPTPPSPMAPTTVVHWDTSAVARKTWSRTTWTTPMTAA